jgi:hypothetical protein
MINVNVPILILDNRNKMGLIQLLLNEARGVGGDDGAESRRWSSCLTSNANREECEDRGEQKRGKSPGIY